MPHHHFPHCAADSAEDVKRKIKKAFCPPEVVEKNPIMDYAQNIIFGYYGTLTVNSQEVCCSVYCIGMTIVLWCVF